MRSLPIALAALLALSVAVPAHAKYDPSFRWRVLETEHFLVHFHQGGEEVARRAAALAEEVHPGLTERLGWAPRSRTRLVLVDSVDYANGWATPFPYNQITVYLTSPIEEPGGGMGPYDDWLRLVITHEYTHVLQLDMVRELPKVLRAIFGRIYFPNMFQPRMLIEGLATYEETEGTSGGRGRSPGVDMVLRMAALENRFPSIGQAAVPPDHWPDGEIPYLFGESFIRFLVDRYGRDKVADLSRVYSGRWLPFLVNSTARRVLGTTYYALWKEWRAGLAAKYEEQRRELEGKGLTPFVPLSDRGYLNAWPAYSPDGSHVAYVSQDSHGYPGLWLRRLVDGREEQLVEAITSFASSGSAIAWAPSGRGIFYTKLDAWHSFNAYNDLWFYDLERRREVRLSRGLRARDPHPSADGRRLVFVAARLGQTRLGIADLGEEGSTLVREEEVTWLTEWGADQWSTPRFSPSGSLIAVAVWRTGGFKDVILMNPQGRVVQEISRDRAHDGAPAWSADGRLLYFSSDRTGVFNLYAWEVASARLRQVTNLLGGAFTPAASPDGARLAFSAYSSRGYDIALVEVDQASWRDAGEFRDPYPPTPPEPAPPAATERGYCPLSTLLPRWWLPWLATTADGMGVGIITSGQDVLQRHAWYLTLLYGTGGRLVYDFQYSYDGLYPTFTFQAQDVDATYPSLLGSDADTADDYDERQRTLGASTTFPLLWARSQHYLTVGFRHQDLSALSDLEPYDPEEVLLPVQGELASLYATYAYVNAQRYPSAISPEDGRIVQLTYERLDDAFGSDLEGDKYTLDWQEFAPTPWRHQVLKLRLFGGTSTGDVVPQRAFQVGGDNPGDVVLGPDPTALSLRGYPENAFRGQHVALAGMEYRFPIWDIQQGAGTTPFFLRRLHGAAFMEAAEAWDDEFEMAHISPGVGVEARLDMLLFYWYPVTLRLVVAQGLTDEGEGQIYISLWLPY